MCTQKPDNGGDGEVGADLEADEAADVMRTREEAKRIKDAQRDDVQDEEIITLDSPD